MSNTGFPSSTIDGTRAITTQSYTEGNIKSGHQFEGSTLYTAAGSSTNNTIFLTGDLPVILKSRSIGYSGSGVSTFIYKLPTYTGGTQAPYQNPNDINPVVGLSQIIVGATVTADGDLVFAPSHLLGGVANNAKGAVSVGIGQEKIFAPNRAYLLKIVNLDHNAAQITSSLSWFEGVPDLPL